MKIWMKILVKKSTLCYGNKNRNRNFYKELIQKAGAETELVYMKASKELLQKRLYKRNQVLNANSPFVITDELLEHVCRHTYCSNMAKSGMNPKTLQYLMGHSDISVTMNVYTHIGFDGKRNKYLPFELCRYK